MKLEGQYVTPGCECYVAMAPQLHGQLGAIVLRDAVNQGIQVQVRQGAHGPELYMSVPARTRRQQQEDRIYIILGPHQAVKYNIVYTWHPGRPLPPLNAETAVKYV
jgi:hypothetical protein